MGFYESKVVTDEKKIPICNKNFSITKWKAQTIVQTAEFKRHKRFKNKGEKTVFPLKMKVEVKKPVTPNLSQKIKKSPD